jgi:hypothetical protein
MRSIVVGDERQGYWRRRQGVGGSPAARRGSATCCREVVDDEEAVGTDGVSSGGRNRRRASQHLRGLRWSNWTSAVANRAWRVDEELEKGEVSKIGVESWAREGLLL